MLMLELLQPFEAATDLRGVQHVVDITKPGPPWTAIGCGRELSISRVEFKSRVKDDRPHCARCVATYQAAVNPPRPKSSRPAPPRA